MSYAEMEGSFFEIEPSIFLYFVPNSAVYKSTSVKTQHTINLSPCNCAVFTYNVNLRYWREVNLIFIS